MGKIKRVPAGRRAGESRGPPAAPHRDGGAWDNQSPEDDPLRDLRPVDEDPPDHDGYEYEWPDLSDGNEDDD
jgi:hypothetical protein